jgi:hypothetical protein
VTDEEIGAGFDDTFHGNCGKPPVPTRRFILGPQDPAPQRVAVRPAIVRVLACEQGHHRRADGSSDVHRARVRADKERPAFD